MGTLIVNDNSILRLCIEMEKRLPQEALPGTATLLDELDSESSAFDFTTNNTYQHLIPPLFTFVTLIQNTLSVARKAYGFTP